MYLSSMDLQRPDVPAKDMGATPSVYLTPHQREAFGHVPIGAAGTELGLSNDYFIRLKMAGVVGLEPTTEGLTVLCSTN